MQYVFGCSCLLALFIRSGRTGRDRKGKKAHRGNALSVLLHSTICEGDWRWNTTSGNAFMICPRWYFNWPLHVNRRWFQHWSISFCLHLLSCKEQLFSKSTSLQAQWFRWHLWKFWNCLEKHFSPFLQVLSPLNLLDPLLFVLSKHFTPARDALTAVPMIDVFRAMRPYFQSDPASRQDLSSDIRRQTHKTHLISASSHILRFHTAGMAKFPLPLSLGVPYPAWAGQDARGTPSLLSPGETADHIVPLPTWPLGGVFSQSFQLSLLFCWGVKVAGVAAHLHYKIWAVVLRLMKSCQRTELKHNAPSPSWFVFN